MSHTIQLKSSLHVDGKEVWTKLSKLELKSEKKKKTVLGHEYWILLLNCIDSPRCVIFVTRNEPIWVDSVVWAEKKKEVELLSNRHMDLYGSGPVTLTFSREVEKVIGVKMDDI